MKIIKNPILTLIGVSLGLALIGCGGSDSTSTQTTTSTTATSTTHNNATSCPDGSLITNNDNITLCKTEKNIAALPTSYQILKSAYPTGFYNNTWTGYTVEVNDKVQATGASGEIGYINSTNNFCWNIFSESGCLNECKDVTDLSGINNSGQTETIGSVKKGLAASNGTEVVNIADGEEHTFSQSGNFHLGWNVNGYYACADSYISVTSIKLIHCEDGNGTTYACP